MNSSTLASGDNQVHQYSPRINETDKYDAKNNDLGELTSHVVVTDNEANFKDRIAQCRSMIQSLKIEFREEKAKLEEGAKSNNTVAAESKLELDQQDSVSVTQVDETSNSYGTSINMKLNYDENLIEYEKQLQKYQNTLDIAQVEKKNAIRRQMLLKAYKLKLMEVENQCNIELLRVKQSLQCLEPLQMMVKTWKNSAADNTYDADNFVLMPRYPELKAASGSDVNSIKEGDNDIRPEPVLDTDC